MKTAVSAVVGAVLLCGCAIFGYEKPGRYWCNEPFLRVDQLQFEAHELNAARLGYMYVTAAALSLQGTEQEDKDHWIDLPARLVPISPDPYFGEGGFQARSFLLKNKNDFISNEALVVAFTGSQSHDFWNDWISTNFLGSRVQHEQARKYFIELTKKYPNIEKRVLTGFSMGGALAAHVGLHPETSTKVTEVWAFNPSLRIYDDRPPEAKSTAGRDSRFWLVANYNEIVRYMRTAQVSVIRGFAWIPAPQTQFLNRVELVKTNPIQGHFRYILTRDLLWAAEQDARARGIPSQDNEPLKILKGTRFKSCNRQSTS